jgi:hypothetical protein
VPLGRTYTIDSGPIAVATTATTPILAAVTGTTNIADIEAIRIGIYSGSGVSYPSNGTVLCTLQRVANPGATTGTLLPRPHNQADLAANTTWSTGGWATTPVPQSPSQILWGQSIPFTAGANWAEWVTPGAEWRVGPVSASAAAAYIALFVACSSAGSGTEFTAELVFSE